MKYCVHIISTLFNSITKQVYSELFKMQENFLFEWSCKPCFALNPFPHKSHLNGFSPLCFLSWIFKLHNWMNVFEQVLHWCGFSLAWSFWCLVKDAFALKLLEQILHWKGFSSLWILSWTFKSLSCLTLFEQILHCNFFLP